MVWEIVALVSGLLSVGVAAYMLKWVLAQPVENEVMIQHSLSIQEGAMAYLRRLFSVLGVLAIVVMLVILFTLGWQKALAYIVGSSCSALAAYAGIYVATRANARVAFAARSGLKKAFPVGFNAGTVMGFSVVGLALIGMSIFYMIFGDPEVILGFSFGATLMALLAKAGGGIYTKTADIGADLVGKVELGLEEDDPRNPGVIADNVGDNVGDVAGTGADMFDSYIASVAAVMILGGVLYTHEYVVFPLLLSAAGILASLLGILFVRVGESNDPGRALNTGTIATTVVFALMTIGVAFLLGFDRPWGVIWPTISGLLAGVILGFTSDHFTDIDQSSVQNTSKAAQTGPALVILEGFSYGLLSVVPSLLGICAAMLAAWFLAEHYGVAGTYGVSVAAVGMMAITGMIISSDAYGPIADNAKGCAEVAHEGAETIRVCDRLDAAGNTSKAIAKGFAVGAAALTVLALFSAYSETVGAKLLDLRQPGVFVGVLIGSMMPPLFSALTILSVSRNAFVMVEEIRRQFREIPGLIEGTARPDSSRCVDIATRGALRELVLPGVLSLVVPILVGVFLGKYALGGFLAGSIVTGIVFAVLMANAGGLWDNAKKFIEDGAYGGKGSEAHKAAVVGDTVGDPFKDTAGPSLNTLITAMSLSASVFGPIIAKIALFNL